MEEKRMQTIQIKERKFDLEGYFKPVSEVKCPFCNRPLIYDPVNDDLELQGKITRDFWEWICEKTREHQLQNIRAYYVEFTSDADIVVCELHGSCHEKCDAEFHLEKGIPLD